MISWLRRPHRRTFSLAVLSTLACLLLLVLAPVVLAQTDDLSDAGADPVKLFERGQTAHARGELERALEFYDEAVKLRPEFPEAEFQRGSVLVALGRVADAEGAFRKAIVLRKEWSMPYASLGTLLIRSSRDRSRDQEAAGLLRQALKLDAHNDAALRGLADVHLRAGDFKEAEAFAKRATAEPDPPASSWVLLALAQRGLGDKVAAETNLDRALAVESTNVAALVERADLRAEEKDFAGAIADLKAARSRNPTDKQIGNRLLGVYERAGRVAEADQLASELGVTRTQPSNGNSGAIQVAGTPEEIEAANSDDPLIARKALAVLLQKNPRNGMLLAKLGAAYRVDDPPRSLEFYRQANEVEPKNPGYATGYASALIQARRFGEAVGILRQVTAAAPDSFAAHANLATALYELKRFDLALPEYQWLLQAKPELAITHFFIATAHDKLGEYEDALSAYEAFLAKADAKTNQLEIEKVQLRLPPLKKQIQLKQGVRHKQ